MLYIKRLLQICDVVMIQEHWLFNDNISSFAEKIDGINIHGVSGMTENEYMCGRPYGGCAILWRKSLNCSFTPISHRSKRIAAGILHLDNLHVNLLLFCVYMPCDGSHVDQYRQSYDEVIADIHAMIENSPVDEIILAGDFNTDLSRVLSHKIWSDAGRPNAGPILGCIKRTLFFPNQILPSAILFHLVQKQIVPNIFEKF